MKRAAYELAPRPTRRAGTDPHRVSSRRGSSRVLADLRRDVAQLHRRPSRRRVAFQTAEGDAGAAREHLLLDRRALPQASRGARLRGFPGWQSSRARGISPHAWRPVRRRRAPSASVGGCPRFSLTRSGDSRTSLATEQRHEVGTHAVCTDKMSLHRRSLAPPSPPPPTRSRRAARDDRQAPTSEVAFFASYMRTSSCSVNCAAENGCVAT